MKHNGWPSSPKRRRLLIFGTALIALALPAAPALAAPPSFGSAGSGAGQLSEPRGVAVEQESGDLYIGDRNNNRIAKFGPEGEFLLAWGWGVADGAAQPQSCGPESVPLSATCRAGLEGSGAGQLARPEGIAVDNSASPSHGDLYVVDRENHRIEKFGPAGEFILAFGEEGTGPGQFERLNGRSIAVGPGGGVFVADENRVQRFSPAGVLEAQIPISGGGFSENLAVDSAGALYLHSRELPGVRKYDQTGAELGAPRDEAGEGEGLAIAIGPADELFVNDFQSSLHHLLGFDSAGAQLASFDRGGRSEDGERGIAYGEEAGAIYVLGAGSVRIVPTPPPGPLIVPGSESANPVATTGATLGALLNPEGAETEYHLEYGLADCEGGGCTATATESLPAGFEDHEVSVAITGLAPRTTYHYRLVATNANGTAKGLDQSFETLPPVSIDSTSASLVSANSATLETELNPHGLPSEYHFEYGPTTAYGTSAPFPDAGAGSGSVDVERSVEIQGLQPSTTYHYRVLAHNALGLVAGPDRSFTTQGAAAALLPDGRVWEMVSPPNKHGSPLEPLTEEGGLIQAATHGDALTYVSLGPINGEPAGVRSPAESQLLSRRGEAGWSTTDITTPHLEISKILAGFPAEYKFFADDLSAGIVEPEGVTPLSPQTTERTPYRREDDGTYLPLITTANVLPGTAFGGEEIDNLQGKSGTWANGVVFRAASPDLRHVLLSSTHVLTPGFTSGFESTNANLYELTDGSLSLISVLPDGKPAAEAGLESAAGQRNLNLRGALSGDGNRVFFEAASGGSAALYVRDLKRAETARLDEPEPGAVGGAGSPAFQGASEDGTRVFFTDASRLTTDSTAEPAKPDLYMCEVVIGAAAQLGCELSDLSVDHHSGEAADVQGEVSAIDADGTHVYFAANGVLTDAPNSRGEYAVPGVCNSEGEASCNLYSYDTESGQISLVAVLSSHDDPDWAGRSALRVLGNLTARTSPNGRYFAFMSQRPLTGYDNRDRNSGARAAEVFLFDSGSGELRCASCNPTGARPLGVFDKEAFPGLLVDHPRSWGGRTLAASLPGYSLLSAGAASVALHQPRYLADSGRLFFTAADALVPQDTNGVMDIYQYEPPSPGGCAESSPSYSPASGGCASLISSGTSPEESALLDASESGDDVFFLTAAKLAPTDTDNALDVYDAAVGGSTHEAIKPVRCEGDACQQPATPPAHPTPGTALLDGPGNAKQKKCPKGKVRKGSRCKKKHPRHTQKHKAAGRGRARAERRAGR